MTPQPVRGSVSPSGDSRERLVKMRVARVGDEHLHLQRRDGFEQGLRHDPVHVGFDACRLQRCCIVVSKFRRWAAAHSARSCRRARCRTRASPRTAKTAVAPFTANAVRRPVLEMADALAEVAGTLRPELGRGRCRGAPDSRERGPLAVHRHEDLGARPAEAGRASGESDSTNAAVRIWTLGARPPSPTARIAVTACLPAAPRSGPAARPSRGRADRPAPAWGERCEVGLDEDLPVGERRAQVRDSASAAPSAANWRSRSAPTTAGAW